ncbi:Clavaminate synthase-like protein [Meredithblackwellia eburnea MCA 4105]
MKLPVLSLASSEETLATQFKEAALEHGFLEVVDHGLPQELISRAFAAAELFFALPMEEKVKLERDSWTNRGYELIGGQNLEGSLGKNKEHEGAHLVDKEQMSKKVGDSKEGLMMGYGGIKEGDEYWGRYAHGPNRLPPDELVPGLKGVVDEYFQASSALSMRMMRIVALSLGLDPENSFVSEVTRDPIMAMRFLHYPPSQQKDVTGIGSHTDFGFITLLATDGTQGLELYADGKWNVIEPRKNAFILNIGDSLSRMTNAEYKSSLHRVINTSGVSRYSMPLFLEGNSDFQIRPLGTDPASTESFDTVEDVLRSRFDSTYSSK